MGTSQFLQTLKTFFIFERVWGIFWENFLFCFTLAHARLYSLESVWMLSYGGMKKPPLGGVVPRECLSGCAVVRSRHAIQVFQNLLEFEWQTHKLEN